MMQSFLLFPRLSCLIAVLQLLGGEGFPIASHSIPSVQLVKPAPFVPGRVTGNANAKVNAVTTGRRRKVPVDSNSLFPFSGTLHHSSLQSRTQLQSQSQQSDQRNDSGENGIWLPQLRRVMGGIAMAGALETAFLTFEKLSGSVANLCGTDGNCNVVLSGPYSNLPFTEIPLSAAGLVAYTVVAFLALQPLVNADSWDDDSENRVLLTAMTTAMATFSIGLMILLFGVLQTTCPYCIFSATCSVLLAKLAWIGGCLPKENRKGAGGAVSASFATAIVGTVLLFVSAEKDVPFMSMRGDSSSLASSITLLATSDTKQKQQQQQQLFSPPEITTDSSPRALELASSLQAMDAKMYGAYWCSHCYDQKEVLGKQAFGKITYVECSKDGVNSQTKLCRSKDVPGYPTWEIQGQLYPGQQDLEELEELVQNIRRGGGGSTAVTSLAPSSQ